MTGDVIEHIITIGREGTCSEHPKISCPYRGERERNPSMKKRMIGLLLAVVMAFSLLPATAFAAVEKVVASGACGAKGSSITWKLSGTGTLTISGKGSMEDYEFWTETWDGHRSEVKAVVVESGVTYIGAYAFDKCVNLTSVKLPGSVTELGFASFRNCSKLKSIALPRNLTGMDSGIFANCTSLTAIQIPESVKVIGADSFYGCTSLTAIRIPKKVTKIGGTAFARCTSLKEITVDAANASYCSVDGMLYNKAKTTLICCPGNKDGGFAIPSSVKTIGVAAFLGCTRLKTLALPDGIKTIESWAFGDCSSLTALSIPKSVTKLPLTMVDGCENLRAVGIPVSVTEIESGAFGGCESLQDVYYDGSEEDWQNIYIDEDNEILEEAKMHYSHVHKYTAKKTAATCTGKGYTSHTCICGDSYVDNWSRALGHSYKNGTCTRCGAKDPNYKPAAPTVKPDYLTASGKPYLKWSAVSGAAKYEVYRSGSKSGTYKRLGTTTKTNYTDSTASAGYTYFYKVKAVNAGGVKSAYSAAVSAISHCAKPVVKAEYIASTGKPYLKWTAVTGARKYQVYRASSSGGTYKLLGTTTKSNYTDSTASAGYTYYYKVKAVSKVKTAANSAYSAAAAGICHCARPVVQITTSSGKPKLTWSAVAGAEKYYVYRSTEKNGTYEYQYSTKNLFYTNKTAKAGKTYYYKVKAVSKVKTSANSSFSVVKSIRAK